MRVFCPKQVVLLAALFLCGLTAMLRAAEVIPPSPPRYFNDYAHVVKTTTVDQLNEKLTNFEKETSNQVVVAIYPKMQSDSSIEDYTQRVAESWRVGGKLHKNGVVFFVFVNDHASRIEVGYGLEGALPDATAHQILDNEVVPRFRNNDFDGGVTAGVDAIIAATKGEYHGTGSTVGQQPKAAPGGGWMPCLMMALFGGLMLWSIISSMRRGTTVYGPGGYRSGWGGVLGGIAGGLGGMSRGGGGGGGFSGGGGFGGGFSGGGGSFGGGGATGRW